MGSSKSCHPPRSGGASCGLARANACGVPKPAVPGFWREGVGARGDSWKQMLCRMCSVKCRCQLGFLALLPAGSTSPRCWAAGPILCLGAHRTPARTAIKPRSRCFQRSASCNRLGSSPSGGFPTPGSGWRAAYGDGWRAKTLGLCRSAPGRDVLSRRARGTLMVAVSTTLLRRPQWHQKLTV